MFITISDSVANCSSLITLVIDLVESLSHELNMYDSQLSIKLLLLVLLLLHRHPACYEYDVTKSFSYLTCLVKQVR